MSNNERSSRRKRLFDKVLPKSWSKSRGSSKSRNSTAHESPANTTNATAPSAPLSAVASPSNIASNRTGNANALTAPLGTTTPDHVATPSIGPYMDTGSPALAVLPPDDPSNTTEGGDGIATSNVATEILTGIAADAQATTVSTFDPPQDPIDNSSTKEFFRTTWHGIEYLLKNVEKCLDGTPFKAPIAALNVVIELGNTVIDNKDTLQDLVLRTTERLEIVKSELTNTENAPSKEMKERFVGKLIAELAKLDSMSKQATWKRVLDNQEIKNKIEGTFKQIDEYMKDLQLHLTIRVDRNVQDLSRGLMQLKLEGWPRFPKATYDANIGESTSFIRERCTPETRTSILADIYKWANDSSTNSPSVFWLTGEAGSGKSTLAYTVAEHFDDDGSILGGNFFCSRQFGETREQRNIIPTIVYQLARKSRSFAQALLDADKRDSVDRILSKQMKDLFVGPWQESTGQRRSDFPPYLVVIDALDEINGTGGSDFLEELLKTINVGHLQRLKFLVTSRPDPRIADLCTSFSSEAVCHLHEVPRETVKADITTYLRAKLPALRDHEQLTKLAGKADGLFVYAATAVRHITPRPSMAPDEQLHLINKLLPEHVSPMREVADTPPLVDELYKQILRAAFSELDDDLLHSRLSILHTILCTQERVSTSVAAALYPDHKRMQDIADVVVKDLHAVLYVKDGCVFWYHASFPDFIFTPTRSKFTFYPPSSSTPSRDVDMSCDKASHHALLTRSCFRVMMSPSLLGLRFNICQLPSSFLLDSEVLDLDRRIQENISDVLRYCCRYWVQHLVQTTPAESDGLFNCIEEFLTIHVLFWIEAMNLLKSSALCTSMLQRTRNRVSECTDKRSNLAQDLTYVANFATYFTGSPAALSTPHLYISSLTIWSQNSTVSQQWQKQFPLLPSFRRTGDDGSHSIPLMTIPTGDRVNGVAFSGDGTRIVSGSSDQSVRVWDASSGAELKVLNGHTQAVTSVAFSGDGTRIVSGSSDQSVRVWDASSGAELKVLNGHTQAVTSVAFSGDGTRIVSGSWDESVRVWDASSGAELKVLNGHTWSVSSVAFSGDGTRIVSGSEDESVRVWDASSGAELKVLNGHTNAVWSVAFSGDGTRIVSGSWDASVRVWDASSGAELKVLNGHTQAVSSVAFSCDGTRIVSGSPDASVRVWDASSGAELKVLNGHTQAVFSVAFSGDGTRIVSGSPDASVRVWNASSGAELKVLNGHTQAVSSVAFSCDGTRIVSGSWDASVRVWDASSGAELKVLNGHTDAVLSVAFSGDGTRIVSGSKDESVRVWDASSGAELKVLNGHTRPVSSVAFSGDGTRIVSGSWDASVRVWNASSGAELKVLNGHTNAVSSVAFSGDGTRIVSGSSDQSVRVWDASNGAELKVLNGHTHAVRSVAFSGDGARIVSGSWDESVRVWDASSGAELKVLNGHTRAVLSVAFSGDGTRIVSGSWDESVRVWDASSSAELTVLNGHTHTVWSVAFSGDGTRIVSGSFDQSVRVWDLLSSAMSNGSEDRSVRVWDLGHDDNLHWMFNEMNWIVSDLGKERLIWLPLDIRLVLNPPYNSLTITRKHSTYIDFRTCKVGSDWANCYTTMLP